MRQPRCGRPTCCSGANAASAALRRQFHAEATALLSSLDIPISDTTRPVAALSGGQRQLVAVARAMRDKPRLLILDEPTASLGVFETAQVEGLARRLCDEGTTILLVSHDIDQMFRLADRIIVLRQGRVVADVPTATGHPDEIVAFMSGQPVDSSPRRQLDRLHSLVGRLTHVDPSSSLAVILSALGTALAADRLCIHLLDGGRLRLTAAVGLPDDLLSAWSDLPVGTDGGPAGAAAATESTVIDPDVRTAPTWARIPRDRRADNIRSSWAVPVTGSGGLLGVITVFRRSRGTPHRDELDLVTLYAGYAASTAERDGLLGEVTARNRVLETIRVVLEQLAVSVPLSEGLDVAVDTLRLGLGAEEVGLLGWHPDEGARCRGLVRRPQRRTGRRLTPSRRAAGGPRHRRPPPADVHQRRPGRSSRRPVSRHRRTARATRRVADTPTARRTGRATTPPRCSRTRPGRCSSRSNARPPSARTARPRRCAARRSCSGTSCPA